jgi:MinD-like ATPase involved in chromosome partitioning or flagellar assembly
MATSASPMSTFSSASARAAIWAAFSPAAVVSMRRSARSRRAASISCPAARARASSGCSIRTFWKRLLAELRALARGYDLTLLDLPAGVDHAVRRLLAAAEIRLVVTTDEPTALTDAYALIKLSHRADGGDRLRLVVNLAASHDAGRQTYQGFARVCEHFLQLRPPLAGVVRRDPRVADAVRNQTPFLLRHPGSPAARDVEALARQVASAA